jgi:hypothetical protein
MQARSRFSRADRGEWGISEPAVSPGCEVRLRTRSAHAVLPPVRIRRADLVMERCDPEAPFASNNGHLPSRFFQYAGIAVSRNVTQPAKSLIESKLCRWASPPQFGTRFAAAGTALKRDRSTTQLDGRVSPQLNINALARMPLPVLYRPVKYADSTYYFLV